MNTNNLSTSEDRIFRQIFEECPAGLIVLDRNGKLFQVNPAFCKLLGYSREECLSLSWWNLLGSEDDSVFTEVEKLWSGELKNLTLERKLYCKSPENLWLYIDAKIVQQDDGSQCAVVAVFDITEKKKQERALKRNEWRFRVVEKAAESAVWEWNPTRDVIHWSPGVQQLLGYSDKDFKFDISWWKQRIHKDDRDRVLSGIDNAIKEKKKYWSTEYRYQKADGTYVYLMDKACIQYDKDENPKRIIGVKTNMSEMRRYQQEMEDAKLEAQRANRIKSDFLANMSHEIRTPLSAILGFADFLLEPKLSPSEHLNCLMTIKRNGTHLYRLVNEVLDLSKLESGRFEVERICFPLADLIQTVYSAMKFKADEKGLEFKITTDTSVPRFVKTDPTRFQQILFNLIGNAIKFTQQGHVKVDVKYDIAEAVDSEGVLLCTIEDTGVGLKPSDQNHIFSQFTQADSSITRKFGGTGLGLYISRKLAQALGGDVRLAQSTRDQGSMFEFSVLAGTQAEVTLYNNLAAIQEPAEKIPKSEQFNFDKLKILVVEDSYDNRVWISRVLNQTLAQISMAENGDEACRKAMTESPDIVLMDIQMPVMGGIEAAKKLREAGFQKPIIALTAHASREDRESCIRAGFDDHLSKPVDRSALMSVINHYGFPTEHTLH